MVSSSEAVGFRLEVGDVLGVLLGAVVVELVLVIRQCLEFDRDLVEYFQLLLCKDELLLVVTLADDLCGGDTGSSGTEVVVVAVFCDCLSDLPRVVVSEDVSLVLSDVMYRSLRIFACPVAMEVFMSETSYPRGPSQH